MSRASKASFRFSARCLGANTLAGAPLHELHALERARGADTPDEPSAAYAFLTESDAPSLFGRLGGSLQSLAQAATPWLRRHLKPALEWSRTNPEAAS